MIFSTRIARARLAFENFRKIWHHDSTVLATNAQVYTCIVPVLMNGFEIYSLRSRDIQQLKDSDQVAYEALKRLNGPSGLARNKLGELCVEGEMTIRPRHPFENNAFNWWDVRYGCLITASLCIYFRIQEPRTSDVKTSV